MKKKQTKRTTKRKPSMAEDMFSAIVVLARRHNMCEIYAAEEMFKFCAFIAIRELGKKSALDLMNKSIKAMIKENDL